MGGIFAQKMSVVNKITFMKRKRFVYIISKGVFSLAVFSIICVACINKSNNKYDYKYGTVDEAVVKNMRKDTLNDSGNGKLIHVDCNSGYKEAGYLFHDLKLIPLEANANSLVGEVNKIIVQDSLIYLLDIRKTRSLSVFRLADGKFVRKIGNYGKSNSEYIEPTDFAVAGNQVVILDNRLMKLLVYDLEGNFKRSSRLQFALQTIVKTDVDSVFAGIAGDNRHLDKIYKFRVLKFNLDGHILSAHLKLDDGINYSEFNNLQATSEFFWYHAPFSNDVVFLDGLETGVKYKFQFSKKGLPGDFVEKCNENYENFIEKYRRTHSYVQSIGCYTSRYMISRYAVQGRSGGLLVYDMISDKVVFNGIPTCSSTEGVIEDFLAMEMVWEKPLFAGENNRIYGVIPVGGVTDGKVRELLGKEDALDSNPVIFCVDIKDICVN